MAITDDLCVDNALILFPVSCRVHEVHSKRSLQITVLNLIINRLMISFYLHPFVGKKKNGQRCR